METKSASSSYFESCLPLVNSPCFHTSMHFTAHSMFNDHNNWLKNVRLILILFLKKISDNAVRVAINWTNYSITIDDHSSQLYNDKNVNPTHD